jgi:quercetin dioxygenase-like cupin family protein
VELDVRQLPVLLAPGEAGEVVVDQPRRTLRILFSHELLDVTWTRHEAGERGAEPHVHREHADAFYVLEGELTFRIGPELERVTAPAGTFVAVPPGVVHGFDNDGTERTRFLNFHSPSGGFADYLRGAGGFDSFDPPADGGRPAAEAIVSLPGEGEQVRSHRIKAELPHLSAIELVFEPGWEGVDPHVHSDHVDSFFVLEGTAEFIGGPAGPGTFVAAAPCVVHGFQIAEGCDRLAMLNVHAPDSGFVGRLRRP